MDASDMLFESPLVDCFPSNRPLKQPMRALGSGEQQMRGARTRLVMKAMRRGICFEIFKHMVLKHTRSPTSACVRSRT